MWASGAEAASQPSHGFTRLSDLLTAGLPDLAWLVAPIFTTDALGMIGAEPKCFKSFMLAHLAVAVSTGAPWLDTFTVHRPGPVVLVSPEGGVHGLLRRVMAILASIGGSPSDLDIAYVRTRGLSLTDARDIEDLKAAVRESGPVLIAYDSIYAGLQGVKTAQLSEFAGALRVLSELAQANEAAVVVTHHFNAKEGSGVHRLTGAGPAEWTSAALLGTRGANGVAAGTTKATVNWSLTARDVPEMEFSTTFSLGSKDPGNLASPLDYGVSVVLGEGQANSGLGWIEDRVVSALGLLGGGGRSLQDIDDVLARDGHGKALKYDTLREVLGHLVDLCIVDGADGHWWLTAPDEGA